MLTSDLIRPVIRSGRIAAPKLKGKKRSDALELATVIIHTLNANIGQPREHVEDAFAQLDIPARELFLYKGLKKLAFDGCTFESPGDVDPVALRRQVFGLAAKARREGGFDRAAVLAQVATTNETGIAEVESSLFADLKSAQLLLSSQSSDASTLVSDYDKGAPKAILLKATKVVVTLEANAATIRRVLHRLKFLRLLFELSANGDEWTLSIDGPMSLFSGQARYGLKLAIALDAFEECARYRLEAEVRWGKRKTRTTFAYEGGGGAPSDIPVIDDVARVAKEFADRPSGWDCEVAPQILSVPSVGACVTDLRFVHRDSGEVVLLEVLGYWSRDAVFRRVDLVSAGLSENVIFAFSQKLRVEEVCVEEDCVEEACVEEVCVEEDCVEEACVEEACVEKVGRPSIGSMVLGTGRCSSTK